MADAARRSGWVAYAAGGRGQGAGACAAPCPLRPRTPRWGQPSLTGSRGTPVVPLVSSLPRGSGRSASRCPAWTRDERPSGVGASAPVGAAISSAPCRAHVNKRNRCSRFASGTPSLDVGREKRLSFVESVQWVGEWDALSVVDFVQRNKTGQASCRGEFVAVMYRPLLRSGKNGFPLLSRCTVPERRCCGWGNAPRWPEHGPRQESPTQRAGAPQQARVTARWWDGIFSRPVR